MLFLPSLILIPLVLSAALRRRVEFVLPMLASVAILLAYGFAMARALEVLKVAVMVAAALCVVWVAAMAARGQGKALWGAFCTYTLKPGLLGFGLLMTLFLVGQRGHVAVATEEISFWALQAKGIFAQQGLVGGALHLAPRFGADMPGLQLFQWFGAAVGGACTDGMLYGMLNVFYAVYLLPFAVCIPWRRAWLLPVYLLFAIALPTAVNRDAYALLRGDAAMGVCLGYCLAMVWRLCRNPQATVFDALCLGLGVCVLALVKQAGAAWALMPLTLLMVLGRRYTRPVHAAKWLALAAPVLAVGSWLLFCHLHGLQSPQWATLMQSAAQVLAGSFKPPATAQGFAAALWRAATRVAIGGAGGVPSPLFGLPLIGWAMGLLLLPLVLALLGRQPAKDMAAVSLWLGGCFAMFVGCLAAANVFGLAGEPGVLPTGGTDAIAYLLERYLSPGLIGVLALLAAMVQTGKAVSHRRLAAIAATFAVLLALTANWRQVQTNLIVAGYPQTVPEDIAAMQAENNWITTLEEPLTAVVLYGEEPMPAKRERLQYALLPVKIVTLQGNMGQADFLALLRSKRVTHVLCMDEATPAFALASPYVQEGRLETTMPYRVLWKRRVPVLVP